MELAPVQEGDDQGQEDVEQEGSTNLGEDLMFEQESDEALRPNVIRDPGAPSEKEVQEHSITHLPHRSWCPIFVESRDKDRPHRRVQDRGDYEVPEVHFDYGFLGNKEETNRSQFS